MNDGALLMGQAHYFTSIANADLPKARILARSIKRHDAGAVVHLVLVDVPATGFDIAKEPFDHLHLVRDLDIPNVTGWLFQHDVAEACSGAKGPALWKILTEHKAEEVYYFDPDVVVLHDLAGLKAELAPASVVVTPHLVDAEEREDAVRDHEMSALRQGVYNLGFIGVRNCEAGLAFARWWRDRLIAHCFADVQNGLYADQRWVDLAPALFPEVRILRARQYNVGTWNLTHRPVARDAAGTLTVDGKPLVFFHFSGFDAEAELLRLRQHAPLDSPLFELHDWYVREMENEGQKQLGAMRCIYADYFNGQPIEKAHRRMYRDRADLQKRFPRPFDVDAEYALLDYLRAELLPEALPLAPVAAMSPPSPAEQDLTATITWKVGKLITSPIERAVGLVPGLLPSLKQKLSR